jgi:hypothetical protein
LGELPALRSAVAAYAANDDESDGEEAERPAAPQTQTGGMNPADMVFEASREEMPPLPASFLQQPSNGGNDEGDEEEEWGGEAGEDDGASEGDAPGRNESRVSSEADAAAAGLKEKRKRTKKKKGSKWSEKAASTHSWVYVEGLPPDATEKEVAEHFAKCGVIAIDPNSQQRRIKLYGRTHCARAGGPRTRMLPSFRAMGLCVWLRIRRFGFRYKDAASGMAKGDASICYAKADSVALALQVLDGSCLRSSGGGLRVTKAAFAVKGDAYDPTKRAKVGCTSTCFHISRSLSLSCPLLFLFLYLSFYFYLRLYIYVFALALLLSRSVCVLFISLFLTMVIVGTAGERAADESGQGGGGASAHVERGRRQWRGRKSGRTQNRRPEAHV